MKKRVLFITLALLLSVFLASCRTKSFNVTYDIEGVTETVKVQEGTILDVPEPPEKEGYDFDFWRLVEENRIWNFGSDKVMKNITLKAVFKEIVKDVFKVTFITVGGTPEYAPVDVTDGEKVDRPDVNPTKDGYHFLGWFDADGEEFNFDETVITENIMISAKWEKLPEFVKVTFDVNGGEGTIPSHNIEKGNKVTKPADPTRDGYDFEGWYFNNTQFNFNDPVITSITLVAKWKEIIVTYDVTFILGFDAEYDFDQVLSPGEKVVEPDEELERYGYIFKGWYVGEEEYDFDAEVNSDLTITAKWQAVHAIIFDATMDENYSQPNPIILDGELLEEPEIIPYVEFYIFNGWYLNDELYDFSTPVTSSFTLVAKWEPEPYVARAYIGEVDYQSVALAVEAAKSGDTILIAEGTHPGDFQINVNNLTLTSKDEENKAILTGVITLKDGLNGVKFEGLKFTVGAQIHAPGVIDNFEFLSNIVIDSALKADDYLPNNRIDVNAFIRLYTLAGENIVGNVTIKENIFEGIQTDVISIARTQVNKTIIIEYNEFLNIGKTAIRFDGGYNNGTYLIKGNLFENDVAGTNDNVILFRAYSSSGSNIQIIDILENEFINMGNNSMPREADYPGSSVIAFSTYNEKETYVTIKDNLFVNTENTIHLRNNKGNHQLLTVVINNNIFNDPTGFIFYESDYEPEKDNTDFNLNKFYVDEVLVTDIDDIKDQIINNENYSNILTE